MVEEITYTINEFEKEVIVFNTITCIRLFELGSDVATLYLFYIKNAKIQGTNSIHSTDNFCKKGLGWGEKRFRKAKNILKENKFIEQITKPSKTGIKHYIKIHYLKCNKLPQDKNEKEGLEVSKEVTSFEHTNALDKNINALDKNAVEKEDTSVSSISRERLTEIEELFNYYLKIVERMRKYVTDNNIKTDKVMVKHKSIHSKCTIILPKDKEKAVAIPISEILNEYLDQYPANLLQKSLENYYKIFISNFSENNIYFYSLMWKDLGSFVYSGVHRGTGFKSVLDLDKLKKGYNNLSEIDQLRKQFLPITTRYDLGNVLNKENNTYYGFQTDRLRNSNLMNDHVFELKQGVNDFGDFCWLEEVIASIFFTRKQGFDIIQLKALISLWKGHKKIYKKQAVKMLEEF